MEMRNIEFFFKLIGDKDKKIYAPILYNFDTKLMDKMPKPKYFINSNVLIQQHCSEDMEKIISRYLNHKSSLLFPQKVIKIIAAIFQPNIKDCYLNKMGEAYSEFIEIIK